MLTPEFRRNELVKAIASKSGFMSSFQESALSICLLYSVQLGCFRCTFLYGSVTAQFVKQASENGT